MKLKIILIVVLTFGLSSCSLLAGNDDPAITTTTNPTVETIAPVETVPPIETVPPLTTVSVEPTDIAPDEIPPGEGLDSENLDLDLTLVDSSNPDEVALAVGCAFYARPNRAETNVDLADRLLPLITDDLHAAIPTIRQPGDDIVTVIPAIANEVRFEFYQVSCNRSTTGVNGIPRLDGAFIDLRVEEQADGSFLVSELTIGALTLPEPA